MTLPPENKTPLSDTTSKALPTCTLDPEEYRDQLEDFDLSEDQEKELLQALWQIMSAFVDLGWGVDNLHYVLPETFGQSVLDSDRFDSENQQIETKEER